MRPPRKAAATRSRLGSEDGALGGGVARHGRNFLQLQAGDETGRGGDAAPAVELPASAQEFDFGSERDVENHLGDTAIELLWESEKRAPAKLFAVSGAPDGDVEGFLFDLVSDGEDAKESAGSGLRDFNGRAVAVGFEGGVFGDEDEFEGQGEFPSEAGSLAQVEMVPG